eukprot:TRINITY_DN1427_c0_g1_i1.p1 TRINITY_DN1427_c0_g1~~TRINITY_DN1427_c0_g1_i1.p1  ORF type:complete len:930 (-),score=212.71 TRINITY_DN1427_c0_g1_i1:197-2986(-)
MSDYGFYVKRKNLRQRALDITQPLQIFHEELPDDDQADSYRGMKILGSGMTADEEAEGHLQEALKNRKKIPLPHFSEVPDYEQVNSPTFDPTPHYLLDPDDVYFGAVGYEVSLADKTWLSNYDKARKRDDPPIAIDDFEDIFTTWEFYMKLSEKVPFDRTWAERVVVTSKWKRLVPILFPLWNERRKRRGASVLPKLLTPEEFEVWLENSRLKKTAQKTGVPLEKLMEKRDKKRGGKSLPDIIPSGKRGPMGQRIKKKSMRKITNNVASFNEIVKMRWDLHRARVTMKKVQAREELKKLHIELWLKRFELLSKTSSEELVSIEDTATLPEGSDNVSDDGYDNNPENNMFDLDGLDVAGAEAGLTATLSSSIVNELMPPDEPVQWPYLRNKFAQLQPNPPASVSVSEVPQVQESSDIGADDEDQSVSSVAPTNNKGRKGSVKRKKKTKAQSAAEEKKAKLKAEKLRLRELKKAEREAKRAEKLAASNKRKATQQGGPPEKKRRKKKRSDSMNVSVSSVDEESADWAMNGLPNAGTPTSRGLRRRKKVAPVLNFEKLFDWNHFETEESDSEEFEVARPLASRQFDYNPLPTPVLSTFFGGFNRVTFSDVLPSTASPDSSSLRNASLSTTPPAPCEPSVMAPAPPLVTTHVHLPSRHLPPTTFTRHSTATTPTPTSTTQLPHPPGPVAPPPLSLTRPPLCFPTTYSLRSSRPFRGRRRLGRGGRIHLDRRPLSRTPLPQRYYVTPEDEVSDELLPSPEAEETDRSSEEVDAERLSEVSSPSATTPIPTPSTNITSAESAAHFMDTSAPHLNNLLNDPMDIDSLLNAPVSVASDVVTLPPPPSSTNPFLSPLKNSSSSVTNHQPPPPVGNSLMTSTTSSAMRSTLSPTPEPTFPGLNQASITLPPPPPPPPPPPSRVVVPWNLPNWRLFVDNC